MQDTGRSAGVTKEGAGKSAFNTKNAGWEFRRMDAELDKGATGPLWLRDCKIASVVEHTLYCGEELKQYELDTYVVMPNHVHVLLWPCVPMAHITAGIKGVSARDANLVLGRTGMHFWDDESFDHWVRNDIELRNIRIYLERNPVTAGLVERPEDWRWSSAAKKRSDTATPGCAGKAAQRVQPCICARSAAAGRPCAERRTVVLFDQGSE
jgi:putative DNA methylase